MFICKELKIGFSRVFSTGLILAPSEANGNLLVGRVKPMLSTFWKKKLLEVTGLGIQQNKFLTPKTYTQKHFVE